MDPQVIYDLNATSDLSVDKQNIVRQLSDMFLGYSLIYIRGICEECLWNVEVCIDKMIGTNTDLIKQSPKQIVKGPVSYKEVVQRKSGAVPKAVPNVPVPISTPASFKSTTQELPEVYANVYNDIANGYKVLVLMRGAPGSGKSYLAKSIVRKLMPERDWKDFILGADDYFFDPCGRYRYNKDRLEDAHKYCSARTQEKTSLGYSPIFIDNTNTELWEMMNYVKFGVENGYIIEIMEPVTPWRNSAGKLASKNNHNVPKAKIERMLDRFQSATITDLLALLKDTKYTVSLPQLRTFPPPPEKAPELVTEPQPQQPSSLMETPKKLDESTHNSSPYETLDPVPYESTIEPTVQMEQDERVTTPIAFIKPNNIWPNFEPLEPLCPAPKPPRHNHNVQEQNPPEPIEKEENPLIFSKPLNPEAASFWGVPFSAMNTTNEYDNNDEMTTQQLFPAVPTAWQAYEQEATNFWGVPMTATVENSEPMITDDNNGNCGLLHLLKEGVKSINVPQKSINSTKDEPSELVRHRVGCKNENQSFVSLRQIYSNKPNPELWDLFVKCNGSIDWAVDILLKDEDSIARENISEEPIENCEDYNCCCGGSPQSRPPSPTNTPLAKPQRPKPARNRSTPSAEVLGVKEALEKSIVLGEEHYSSHVNKIRNKRNIVEDTNNKKTLIDVQVQTDECDENDNTSEEGSEVIEINLGEDLIGQLTGIFISEASTLNSNEKYKTNVFMPKTLARELYILYMESVYNQQEEQRQSLLKEDEEFARLLKHPKYQNCKQPPENIKELLDMEYAWMIYKNEQEQYDGMSSNQPNDLASHLTRMKLCEIFPDIPKETLVDILAAHDNKFSDTVDVLKSSIQPAKIDHQVSTDELIQKARNENEKLNQEDEQKVHSKQQEQSTRQRSLSPEEEKRLALTEFEDSRNYAAHHCQLRAECYQKAKEAIQRGNSSVAVYYSQIANLHKRKIDLYNHRAANCIMEVHDLTQNNPDFIDLHYLHLIEAVSCLDIFVDRHIAKLRSIFRSYKHVFIITGRGLHSTGGVSMIKTRVKSRLKERNLKWSEVNPGLLKVKIFSASKYSKNL